MLVEVNRVPCPLAVEKVVSFMEDDYGQDIQTKESQGLAYTQKSASHRQKLQRKQIELKERLMRVEAALSALDAHPELENFITTLANAGV